MNLQIPAYTPTHTYLIIYGEDYLEWYLKNLTHFQWGKLVVRGWGAEGAFPDVLFYTFSILNYVNLPPIQNLEWSPICGREQKPGTEKGHEGK